MSAELINLKRVRKNQKHDENKKQAEQNRAKFGLSKNEKVLARFEAAKSTLALDGKKRDS